MTTLVDRLFRPYGPVILTPTSKIFGIGLSGTGTHSLNYALKLLGYTAKHYPDSLEDFMRYEALTDISVSCRYRELDKIFPGSKFILTTRDLEGWLANRAKKPGGKKRKRFWRMETNLRTYGTLSYDREKYIARYAEYHAGVREYFAERPGDLLSIDIIGGEGWEKLCAFLGRETPDTPFPKIIDKRQPQ
jgi:hypothetical protein